MIRTRALALGSLVALLVVAVPRAAHPCSPAPCAEAEVDVAEGPAPLTVNLTGVNSLAGTGKSISFYSWDLGDGVPNKVTMGTPHTYLAPGGYTAALTIILNDATEYHDTVFISVTTSDGVRPPRIDSASASPTQGAAGTLSVNFAATAVAPDGGELHEYWRVGVGDPLLGATRTWPYNTAGSYVARFEAIGALGLQSLSQPIVITVRDGTTNPPLVRATTETPAGPPPLHTRLSASMQPDDPADWEWDLGDGRHASGADVDVFYELPGTYWASVVGTHSNGLKGYDQVRIFVTQGDWPPAVVSVPVTRACVGEPYGYAAAARGTPTVTYSLPTAPTGMTVDGATGAVTWTPTLDQLGSRGVTLKVENAAGTDQQQFDLEVTCCKAGVCPEETKSSGCAHVRAGAGGTAGLLALALTVALLGARRRR